MWKFVRDVCEPRLARLQFTNQGQRLLDGLMHRMWHVAKSVEHQVIQVRQQRLGRFREQAEVGQIPRGAKTTAQHFNFSMPRGDWHDPRSNYLERPIDGVQYDARDGADRGN